MAELRGVGNVVRNSVVDTIRGSGEVFDAVEETVSQSLATVLRATGSSRSALTGAVSDVARGALHGAAETGGDLGAAARGTVIGALRGTRGVAGAGLETIGTSVAQLVRTASSGGIRARRRGAPPRARCSARKASA
jgi:hypothetical protein